MAEFCRAGRARAIRVPPRLLSAALVLASVMVVADVEMASPLGYARGTQAPAGSASRREPRGRSHSGVLFKTSDNCMACHNGMTTASGEDVSIGSSWRASMMANSARDPYWQASVRRETIDHPGASAAIQDECSICHMPMARTEARAAGLEGEVFRHLPVRPDAGGEDRLAHDGVSCTMCHQITGENLGTPASFTGGYVVNLPRVPAGPTPGDPRTIFGRFEIEKGLSAVMHSATEYRPVESPHLGQSELCATCHTLITRALGPDGKVIGELPEQVMFLEWRHGAFSREQRSCQSCHMPPVAEDAPVASVLGVPRKSVARHTFVGGNFFMLRILNQFRHELGVAAQPRELEMSAGRTVQNLRTATAAVSVTQAEVVDGRLRADVTVENLTGHKLPTGYPSRRAWIHLTVRDRGGRNVFESGALAPDGSIRGNENDSEGGGAEPHYTEIVRPDQVQIYESVMGDAAGRSTTALLAAVRYLKDNRLLPRGFDKATAEPNIAVVGGAATAPEFTGGRDRVRYAIDVTGHEGPFVVDVELRFQVVGYRWAQNLRPYDSIETRRFVRYYESMSSSSSEVLSTSSITAR